MIGRLEKSLEFRVELTRPDGPVGVLGVPARDARIVEGHVQQREDPCDAWGVARLPVFQKQPSRVLVPIIEVAQASDGDLPEQREALVRGVRSYPRTCAISALNSGESWPAAPAGGTRRPWRAAKSPRWRPAA